MDKQYWQLWNLFYNFGSNILAIFTRRNLIWHFLAMSLTVIFVLSSFDWYYFRFFRNTFIYQFSFSAAIIGFFLPIVMPIVLYLIGRSRGDAKLMLAGFATAQAGLIGSGLAAFYKALTGRAYPPQTALDISNLSKVFHFGFWRAGIFWGWPSSHTTVAFSMSVALAVVYASNKWVKSIAWVYAFYIGLMVAVSIHWFSDFAAGAIFGTLVGHIVGSSFVAKFEPKH